MTEEKRKTVNISKKAHKEVKRISNETDLNISEVAELLLLGYTESQIKEHAKKK